MSTPDQPELKRIAEELSQLGKSIREYLTEPLAPDHEVLGWPLMIDAYGGVFCADAECPLQAENSEIGEFEGREFTITELKDAVAEHIWHRKWRENE